MGVHELLWKSKGILIGGLATTISIFLLRFLGMFQLWELAAFDYILQLKPTEKTDERIVIVGIKESDLQQMGRSQISDQLMADLITKISAAGPRVIGLDLYRNLPVEPGHGALLQVFRSTPNLIGIQKVIDDRVVSSVPGNPVLVAAGRVAASDITVDVDGRVRRGVLFPSTDPARSLESLSLRLALDYLAAMGITPDPNPLRLTLRNVSLPRFISNDGGYVGADDGGYQMLLRLRGPAGSVRTVSAMDVLRGKVNPKVLQDRIVFIGSMSAGDVDVFTTSYSSAARSGSRVMFGVELHAQLTSQIVAAVLDGRPLMRVLPKWAEFCLVLLCAWGVAWINTRSSRYAQRFSLTLGWLVGIIAVSYGCLLLGWWLPLVPVSIGVMATAAIMLVAETHRFRLLSTRDELTQLANRRTFNQTLEREWQQALRSPTSLAVILCDVDYFKNYNDTYGHPQGDECLRQVARALTQAVRRSSDLVARYGGEEFIILLPNNDAEAALHVAKRIRAKIKALQIAHRASPISEFVTVSLGVSSIVPTADMLPTAIVNIADLGLYEAKQNGRNRAVLKLPQSLD